MLKRLLIVGSLIVVAVGSGGCVSSAIDAGPLTGQVPVVLLDAKQNYDHGKAQLANGNLGLALAHFQRADYQRPGDVSILNALAAVYDRMRRFDVAWKYYRQALAVDPGSPQTLNNIGFSLSLAGKFRMAAEYLARAHDRGLGMPELATIDANIRLLRTRVAPPKTVRTGRNADLVSLASQSKGPAVIARTDSNSFSLHVARPRTSHNVATASASLSAPIARADAPKIRASRPVSRGPAGKTAPRPESRTAPKPIAAAPATNVPRPDRRSPDPAVTVEVCNGAGRQFMARRMSRFLAGDGFKVVLRTNDVSFDNHSTIIFYRTGEAAGARRLAALFPFAVELREVADLVADVKLRLGGTALKFDLTLIGRFGQDGMA